MDAHATHKRSSHHSDGIKSDLTTRLNKIEGQIRGIRGMIAGDAYCDDVLNQVFAAQSALSGVQRLLLEAHVKSCVTERMRQGDETAMDELLATVKKLIR